MTGRPKVADRVHARRGANERECFETQAYMSSAIPVGHHAVLSLSILTTQMIILGLSSVCYFQGHSGQCPQCEGEKQARRKFCYLDSQIAHNMIRPATDMIRPAIGLHHEIGPAFPSFRYVVTVIYRRHATTERSRSTPWIRSYLSPTVAIVQVIHVMLTRLH